MNFENLPVIVTGRKQFLLDTHETLPGSNRWPMKWVFALKDNCKERKCYIVFEKVKKLFRGSDVMVQKIDLKSNKNVYLPPRSDKQVLV